MELPADKTLVAEFDAVCKAQGVKHLVGIIATGDQFIASDAKRRWIVETFGAVTGEMESGAVAQVAYINQCPYAILRVISDEADGAATVDFFGNRARVACASLRVVRAIPSQNGKRK